jgi:hypothetical protein
LQTNKFTSVHIGNDLGCQLCLLKVAARRRRNRERRARVIEVKRRAALERALRPGVTVSTHFKAKGGAQSAALKECVVTKIKEGDDGYMVKILLPSGLKQKIPLSWVQAVTAAASNTLQHNASMVLVRGSTTIVRGNTPIVKEDRGIKNSKKGKKKLSEEERAQEIAKRKREKKSERKRSRRERHVRQAEDKERVDIDRTIEEKRQRKKERCVYVCVCVCVRLYCVVLCQQSSSHAAHMLHLRVCTHSARGRDVLHVCTSVCVCKHGHA